VWLMQPEAQTTIRVFLAVSAGYLEVAILTKTLEKFPDLHLRTYIVSSLVYDARVAIRFFFLAITYTFRIIYQKM
jgi:hypothetical protein